MNDTGTKTLERKRNGRMVAGVCAGFSDYFGVDVNIVRLAFVVATFLGFMGALVYLVAWAVVPEEGEKNSIVEQFVSKNQNR
jgi:phage shock protein PspC (stress-responsive transcriptional regulator)